MATKRKFSFHLQRFVMGLIKFVYHRQCAMLIIIALSSPVHQIAYAAVTGMYNRGGSKGGCMQGVSPPP